MADANVVMTAQQFAAFLQAQQAQMQQMIQAVVGAIPQQQQPAQPDFAIVPGGGDPQQPWALTTGEGTKMFLAATKAFDSKFDGDTDKLQHFLDAIFSRARTFGLSDILMVNTAQPGVPNPELRNITYEYGSITREQVIAHAQGYQVLNNRLRQASSMVEALITNSISPIIMDELKQREYKVTVQIAGVPTVRTDGVLMLYELIDMVSVETKATISSIIKTLTGAGLSDLMAKCESDIKVFNNKVNMLMVALRARRREVPDIVPYLFEAYQSCDDTKFTEYMARKEEQYEDNTIDDVTNLTVMKMALEKYKTLVDKGAWKQKTSAELEFIALRAQLEEAQKKLVVKNAKQKPSAKHVKRDGPRNDGEWEWKTIPPKAGEPKTKKFRGNEYIYCPHHGNTKWVLKVNRQGIEHATGCRMAKKTGSNDDTTHVTANTATTETTVRTPSKKDIAIARALATVMQEDMSAITEDEELMKDE